MILERGVTFEKVSVVVLGADHLYLQSPHWYRSLEEQTEKVLFQIVKCTFSMKKKQQLLSKLVAKLKR